MPSLLQNLAVKRNGTYAPAFLFWPARLVLRYQQTVVTIIFDSKSTPARTILQCALRLKKKGQAYVGPQQYGKITLELGSDIQDIKMGNVVFDRSYIVQCQDMDIQAILGGNVQDEMMVLFPVLPSLRVNQKQLTLTAKEIITDEATLGRFIDLGLKVLAQMRGM